MNFNVHNIPLDFLVIGTMKSGTSTIGAYLYDHPQVVIPKMEVHFFDRNESKGYEWYRQVLLQERTPDSRIVGEKTPNYAWDDVIAKKLFDLNPSLKLIWIFRDPVDRIVSHYFHNCVAGREYLGLSRALKLEGKRVKYDLHYGYKMTSHYKQQVLRYLKWFPKSQMLFLNFNDLSQFPQETMDRVTAFLDVDAMVIHGSYKKNAKRQFTYPLVLYVVASIFGRGSRPWRLVNRFFPKVTSPSTGMSNEALDALRSEFSEDIKFLKDECGVDLTMGN